MQFSKIFACKDTEFLLFLYGIFVRPIVENATSVWSPYYQHDINIIENIQRKFTKILPKIFKIDYQPWIRNHSKKFEYVLILFWSVKAWILNHSKNVEYVLILFWATKPWILNHLKNVEYVLVLFCSTKP